MTGGYMGKILFVDLGAGTIKEEPIDEKLAKEYIGGYGLGARIIFSRMKAGVDPLGPENILGFAGGPLTGTAALFGSRYTVMGKSPLTGGWGDANSGGSFGPAMKFAGFDAVFFSGISAKPVYLALDNGKAELKDAGHLWGKDSNETEDILVKEYGKGTEAACIGPSGEKLALISCVMNNKGRAAGRSGLGAVMGSKKLKAIVAVGKAAVPVADKTTVNKTRSDILKGLTSHPAYGLFSNFGTPGIMANLTKAGDAPVKNWGGAPEDFTTAAAISDVTVIAQQDKKFACYRCPMACGGEMKEGSGKYNYGKHVHKPEYETLAAFGSMCLNDDLESIIACNDICNRYGLDTISAGATVAFAIECYENGLISQEDTSGIELKWGNAQAIVTMTEMMAKREGFGDILADGVKVAAEKIGKGADQYAIHVGGQEIPMHDPRFGRHQGTTYYAEATPGRHTQGSYSSIPQGVPAPQFDKNAATGKGEAHRIGSNLTHVMNSAGICMFGYSVMPGTAVPDFLNGVAGWNNTVDDYIKIGERISNIRQAFNAREGQSVFARNMPGRLVGNPPSGRGPLGDITVDYKTQVREWLDAMKWDQETGKPSKEKLMGWDLMMLPKNSGASKSEAGTSKY